MMKYTSIKGFWNWFKENQDIYFCLSLSDKHNQDHWMKELRRQLQSACGKDISADIAMMEDRERASLIFTARADQALFTTIDTVIKHAPYMKEWLFQALYPKAPVDWKVKGYLRRWKLKPDNVYVAPLEFLGKKPPFHLRIFVDERIKITPIVESVVEQMVFNLVGEYAFAYQLDTVTIHSLSGQPQTILSNKMTINALPHMMDTGPSAAIMLEWKNKANK